MPQSRLRTRVVFDSPDSTPRLTSEPCPSPAKGELLIQVAAVSLNFADLLALRNQYQERTIWPHTPGMECAGMVIGIGAGVDAALMGRKVGLFGVQGGLTDVGVFPADACVILPDGSDEVEAAVLPIAYGTSHLALTRNADLKPGQTLAVTGASGGVGLTAVELGKLLGARVIACVRGKTKSAVALEAGADEVIDTDQNDVKSGLRDLGGADVVYDAVGGEVGAAAFSGLKRGGHFLIIGFASGSPPDVPLNHALVKNITLHGFYWGGLTQIDAMGVRASLSTIYDWHASGRITPTISHRFPMSQAQQGLDLLASREATGKIVILP